MKTNDLTLARCLVVWLGLTGGLAVLCSLAAPLLVEARQSFTVGSVETREFDEVLSWLAAVVAVSGGGWLWLVGGAVVWSAVRGAGPSSVPGCPVFVRRLLLAGCGLALTGGIGLPAEAVDNGPPPGHGRHGPVASLAGLPMPDRAESRESSGAPGAPARGGRPIDDVVVRPGDTLWALAANSLPSGASDAQVSDRWHLVWRLNHAAVADPDLIFPGTHLRLPARQPGDGERSLR